MKTIRPYLWALALFLSISSVLQAQTNERSQFTLDDAIQEALTRNRDLSAIKKNRLIADGLLTRARTYPFNPEIDLEGASDRLTGNENEGSYRLGLSQEIEIAGQRGLRIDSATFEKNRIDFEIEDAQRHLISQIQTLYNTLLHLELRITFSKEVIDLNRQLVQSTQDRFEAGEAPELDVGIAQVAMNRAINDKTDLERQAAVSRARLNVLMGRPPQAELNLVGDITFQQVSLNIEKLLEAARLGRPDLSAIRLRSKQADIETDLQKRERITNLRFSTFMEKSRGTIDDASGRTLSDQGTLLGIGLTFSLPILNRRKGEILEAKGVALRTAQEEAALELQVEEEVQQAFSRLMLTQKSLILFQKGILNQSRENLGLIKTAYDVGEIGIMVVIQEQERFVQTNILYFDALFNFHDAMIDLERSVGKRIIEKMM